MSPLRTRLLATRVLLMAVSLVVSLAILELGMRVFLVHFASDDFFLRYASMHQLQARNANAKPLYSRHHYLGHYPSPDYEKGPNRHNSLGFRGDEIESPKPAGQFRIACLGGSTTYTVQVADYKKSYPYLLEKSLRTNGYDNVRVVNAGAAGWSSWESLINFEFRVLDLEPDLIIVYHGINDVHPRLVWPPRHYMGDNVGRRAPVQSIFMPQLLEYSSLWRTIGVRLGTLRSHSDFVRTVERPPATYFGELFRDQLHAHRYPADIFSEASVEEMLRNNPPIFFERNIENIVAIAETRKIRTVLASFAFHPGFKSSPRATSAEYIGAYRETNRLLRRIAEGSGASFYDFANEIPSETRYYVDGRHMTEVGSQLKANLFADYMINAGLIPEQTP